jgi:hypothetical protein
VTSGEDASRIRDRDGATGFALMRRLARVLLRGEKTVRESGPSKRLRAALDPDGPLRVLEAAARSAAAENR